MTAVFATTRVSPRTRHVCRSARLPPVREPHRADAAGRRATRRGPVHLVQARVPQPERQHEGPHRPLHPGKGVAAGTVKRDDRVVEASSGSTSIALALALRRWG